MSTIWFDSQHAKVRAYTASVKGEKSIVKIEIEVSDPSELGFLLRNLGEAKKQADQARRRDVDRGNPKKTKQVEGKALSGRPAMLALPYFGDGEP